MTGLLQLEDGLPDGVNVLAACQAKRADQSGIYVKLLWAMAPKIIEYNMFVKNLASDVPLSDMLLLEHEAFIILFIYNYWNAWCKKSAQPDVKEDGQQNRHVQSSH